MSNSLRAIRNNAPHRVSPIGQDYESLGRQNETLASSGISPTSSAGYERRGGYDPATDPNADRVGVVDYDGLDKILKPLKSKKAKKAEQD